MDNMRRLSNNDYRALAEFRFELRKFLNFTKERARKLGLQPAQHQALLAIRGAPGQRLSVGELGRVMLLRPHSASELAGRLVEKGLVEREEGSDARARLLTITRQGMECLSTLSVAHLHEVRRIRPLLLQLLESFEE